MFGGGLKKLNGRLDFERGSKQGFNKHPLKCSPRLLVICHTPKENVRSIEALALLTGRGLLGVG